jgi:small-conductance mechanosensitive channel
MMSTLDAPTWLGWLLPPVAAMLVWGAATALVAILRRMPDTTPGPDAAHVLGPPLRWVLPALAALIACRIPLTADDAAPLQHLALVIAIAGTAWVLTRAIDALQTRVAAAHCLNATDNLEARRIHTQVRVLARVADTAVWVAALAAILMTWPAARHLGTSLLASAGVAGLVAALAAKPVLSNLIAGLQIALVQPIRIDDVVVVEGHWGRIEEIGATHVVVRIWDQRRLLLPLTWFLERPFENWTRQSAEVLGTVLVWADPTIAVDAVRTRLEAIVRDDPDWDGRVVNLQVTDASERAIALRALVSAADAGRLWNLRCRVREQLAAIIAHEHGAALPKLRVAAAEPLEHPMGPVGPPDQARTRAA